METSPANDSLIPEDLRMFTGDPFNPSSTLSQETALKLGRAIQAVEPLVAAELEARVLADQPAHGIAWIMRLPKEVVTEYEQQIFPVRAHLHDRDWVQERVFGHDASQAIPENDLGLLWRWLGFRYGLLCLTMLFASVERNTLKRLGVSAYLDVNTPLWLPIKIMIAAAFEPRLRTEEGINHAILMASRPRSRSPWRLSKQPSPSAVWDQVLALLRADSAERAKLHKRKFQHRATPSRRSAHRFGNDLEAVELKLTNGQYLS